MSNPFSQFETLFAEPRHFRSDCRLVARAFRQGWLKDSPPEVIESLLERYQRACTVLEEQGGVHDSQSMRKMLTRAETSSVIAQDFDRQIIQALRCTLRAVGPASGRGRPRVRRYVTEFSNRIDVRELVRNASTHGLAVEDLKDAEVSFGSGPNSRKQTIEFQLRQDRGVGTWRLWLVCPRCKCRKMHLYPVRAGLRCRGCARVGYSPDARVVELDPSGRVGYVVAERS